MPHTGKGLSLLFLTAAMACSQSVAVQDGRIVFTSQNGIRKPITDGGLDSDPSLSFDNREVVFVRGTPGHTIETGHGDDDDNELWIASVDGEKQPRRILAGGDFIDGPNVALGAFGSPQFSPDAQRVYFYVAAFATGGLAMLLDLASGKTKFLFYGGVEVIRSGKYRGFLINGNYTLNDFGRVTIYWLADPNGKKVTRIGETESDLRRFKSKHLIR